jgi:hypothetical protein
MMNETTPTNLFGDIVKLLEQYKLRNRHRCNNRDATQGY